MPGMLSKKAYPPKIQNKLEFVDAIVLSQQVIYFLESLANQASTSFPLYVFILF